MMFCSELCCCQAVLFQGKCALSFLYSLWGNFGGDGLDFFSLCNCSRSFNMLIFKPYHKQECCNYFWKNNTIVSVKLLLYNS